MPLTLKIRRFNPEVSQDSWWDEFEVRMEPLDRLLDALHEVKWHQDGTLALRRSCAHGICGSDAMLINGRNALACKVLVKDVAPKVTIEPIRGLAVLKDLIVDMEPFFDGYRSVLPYLVNDEGEPDKERYQSAEERARYDDTTKCILCAACTTSCPIFWGDEGYVGPAAIVNAHRFIFDSRDQGSRERSRSSRRRRGSSGAGRRSTAPMPARAASRSRRRSRRSSAPSCSTASEPGPVKVLGVTHSVTIIPGDGIGPEVAAVARLVLDAADVGIEWIERQAGVAALAGSGELLPEETLGAIRESRVAIKGPISTPVGTGFRSVNVALRQELDLFAAVRPARALPGVPTRHPKIDLVVIRENTEDLYQGIEFERGSPQADALRQEVRALAGFELREDAGFTVKPISVSGTRRIVRFAFEYAKANGRHKVTVGHKAAVMRYSDGLFLKTAEEDPAARGRVELEAMQIDHLTNHLALDPGNFDVLLLPNLYGDILSDLCAGLVGGLGLIPGANIGWEYAVFEPVHGSAPDIAGKGLANPIAIILSGAMLLRHIGEPAAAEDLEWAVDSVLGDGTVRTPDLGGSSTTMEVGEAVAGRIIVNRQGQGQRKRQGHQP